MAHARVRREIDFDLGYAGSYSMQGLAGAGCVTVGRLPAAARARRSNTQVGSPLALATRTPAHLAVPRAVSTKAAEEKKEEFAVGALQIVYNEFSEVRAP